VRFSAYNLLVIVGIIAGGCFWWRLARRDARLLWIYLITLGAAFLGAKAVYVLAEGWLDWPRADRWLRLAAGKSVLGGLLGGYLGARLARAWLNYPNRTGDWFTLVVPLGIITGRVGCLFHGCCLGICCQPAWYTLKDKAGIDRWPSVPAEIAFNLAFLALVVWLHRGFRRGAAVRFPDQHFHLYLAGYGLFRILHDCLRQEPRIVGPVSGYQMAAFLVFALGLAAFIRRSREQLPVARPGHPANAIPVTSAAPQE
jgi:phosphatidylglycerol---prolipoprotein diacylglyceryl transferase